MTTSSGPGAPPLPPSPAPLPPLLTLIRNGFSDSVVLNSTGVKQWANEILGGIDNRPDVTVPVELRRFVIDACDQSLVESRYVNSAVICVIVGSREEASARRYVTPEFVRSQLESHFGVGNRRANQIIKNEILPAMERAIAEYLPTPLATSVIPWSDCEIVITARSHGKLNDVYILHIELTFRCAPSDIVIGITDNESIADRLCAEYPAITEICVPSRGLTSQINLQYYDPNEPRRVIDVPLMHLDERQVDALIGPGANDHLVTFWRFDVPTVASDIRYRLVSDNELSVQTHCFWTAPRRLNLLSIEIDFSGFPHVDEYEFDVVPRMGKLFVTGSDKAKRWSVYGPGRVDPGQGVHINWVRCRS